MGVYPFGTRILNLVRDSIVYGSMTPGTVLGVEGHVPNVIELLVPNFSFLLILGRDKKKVRNHAQVTFYFVHELILYCMWRESFLHVPEKIPSMRL